MDINKESLADESYVCPKEAEKKFKMAQGIGEKAMLIDTKNRYGWCSFSFFILNIKKTSGNNLFLCYNISEYVYVYEMGDENAWKRKKNDRRNFM